MTITIGASRNNCKIGSRLLQWWMGTDYSHVFVSWDLHTQERTIVYHAAHGMVHFKSLTNFFIDDEITHRVKLELTDEQFKKLSQTCIDLAGIPYSKLELLQIFLCDITKGRIKTEDQPGYICSELVGELLTDLGYKFNKPQYLLTPKDIMEALSAV
jgi:hypothetical protein